MHQINLIIRTSLDKNKKFNLFLGKILLFTVNNYFEKIIFSIEIYLTRIVL
jgi:hypothetical protein